MAMREPFGPVDANHRVRKRLTKPKPQQSSNTSIASSLRSGSIHSTLLNDNEYAFLTNPKEAATLGTTAVTRACNSSSKTPKISNVTETTRAAGKQRQPPAGVRNESLSQAKICVDKLTAANRSIHLATNHANSKDQSSSERLPIRRRRRAKMKNKSLSEDQSMAFSATGEFRFEDTEGEGDSRSSQRSVMNRNFARIVNVNQNPGNEVRHADRAEVFNAASTGTTSTEREMETSAFPASKRLRTEGAGIEKPSTRRVLSPKKENSLVKESHSTKLHSGDESHSDMDETSDDELLGITQSHHFNDKHQHLEALKSANGEEKINTENVNPPIEYHTPMLEESVPQSSEKLKPVALKNQGDHRTPRSTIYEVEHDAPNQNALMKIMPTAQGSPFFATKASSCVRNLKGRAAPNSSTHHSTACMATTYEEQHSKYPTLTVFGSHQLPILHTPAVQCPSAQIRSSAQRAPLVAPSISTNAALSTAPLESLTIHRDNPIKLHGARAGAESFRTNVNWTNEKGDPESNADGQHQDHALISNHAATTSSYTPNMRERSYSLVHLDANKAKSMFLTKNDPKVDIREKKTHNPVLPVSRTYHVPGSEEDLLTQARVGGYPGESAPEYIACNLHGRVKKYSNFSEARSDLSSNSDGSCDQGASGEHGETLENSRSKHYVATNAHSALKSYPMDFKTNEAKLMHFALGVNIETKLRFESQSPVPTITSLSRTSASKDDYETQTHTAGKKCEKLSEENASMDHESYKPIDQHVWQAMTAKPEASMHTFGPSPIGLVVETSYSRTECDDDDESIDGSELTRETFLVCQKQECKNNQKSDGVYAHDDLRKEGRRYNSPSDKNERLDATDTQAGALFAYPPSGTGLRSRNNKRLGINLSVGNALIMPMKTPATTDCAGGGMLQTPHIEHVIKPRTVVVRSADAAQTMERNSHARTTSIRSNVVDETVRRQTARVSNITNKPREEVLKTCRSFKNARSDTSVADDHVNRLSGKQMKENDCKNAQQLPETHCSPPAMSEYDFEGFGSGATQYEQLLLQLLDEDIHSGIMSPKKMIPVPVGVKPALWTAEHAGRKYEECGFNAAPVFQLADGTYYQHPPLPPGWTLAVSRSKNVPFYIHPDFGVTYYCPVPLMSANGTINGKTLHFQVDSPSSVGQMWAFSTSSEIVASPIVFRNPSSEISCYGSSGVIPPSTGGFMRPKTPLGALVVATHLAFSDSEHGVLAPPTASEHSVLASTGWQSQAVVNMNTTNPGTQKCDSGRLSTPTSEASTLPCHLVPSKEVTSEMKNVYSSVDPIHSDVSAAQRRQKCTSIPFVVEIVTKSGIATEDDKFRANLDTTAEYTTLRSEDNLRDDNHSSQVATGSNGKQCNKAAFQIAGSPSTPPFMNDSTVESLDWFNEVSSRASGSGASPDKRVNETYAACLTETSVNCSIRPNEFWHHPIATGSNHHRDSDLTPEDAAHQRSRDTPHYLVPSSARLADEIKEEALADQRCDEARAPRSDDDFPQAYDFEVSVTSDYDGCFFSNEVTALSHSLPTTLVFESDPGDDNVSYLQSTPIRRMDSSARDLEISERFKPAAVFQATRCDEPSSVLVGNYCSFGSASDDSYDATTSRSHATGQSSLSRVSYRARYPRFPLCSLQNLDAPKALEKSSNNSAREGKKKPKKKSSSSRKVPISM